MRQKGRMVEEISDLAGPVEDPPGAGRSCLRSSCSRMAGIPPLAGFFAKLYVFVAAIEAASISLAIIGVLASVVGAYYYLRIIKVMYFDEPVERSTGHQRQVSL